MIIKEHHLDTFGHVNNATYLSLLEEARWELITKNGFGLREIQMRGQGPVILELNIKFLSELRLREKIRITTELLEYPSKVGKLKQQILKEDGTISCEAIMSFGLFDTRARKLLTPTEIWLKAISNQK